jgi:hypothetical protein
MTATGRTNWEGQKDMSHPARKGNNTTTSDEQIRPDSPAASTKLETLASANEPAGYAGTNLVYPHLDEKTNL